MALFCSLFRIKTLIIDWTIGHSTARKQIVFYINHQKREKGKREIWWLKFIFSLLRSENNLYRSTDEKSKLLLRHYVTFWPSRLGVWVADAESRTHSREHEVAYATKGDHDSSSARQFPVETSRGRSNEPHENSCVRDPCACALSVCCCCFGFPKQQQQRGVPAHAPRRSRAWFRRSEEEKVFELFFAAIVGVSIGRREMN